ncbi:MAG: hypothetical protein AB7T49_19510 [Oligoflexales bacterium]
MKLQGFLTVTSLFFAATAQAGFVSSNGETVLAGIVCQMNSKDGSKVQLQVKAIEGFGSMRARLVQFEGEETQVTYLTESVACEVSRYPDEPQIENRCKSVDGGSSELQVVPHRDRLFMMIESPLILGGKAWYNLPLSDCEVIENTLILP